METAAVFGGASPSFPSSHQRKRTCSSLPSTHHNPNLRAHHHHQLSAFPSSLHLFSYFPARPHARTLAKPRIFLPHLVASLEQVDETYIMVKPDGVQRGLVGEIISRFEKKGFKLTGLKLFQCPQDLAEQERNFIISSSEPKKLLSCLAQEIEGHEIQSWGKSRIDIFEINGTLLVADVVCALCFCRAAGIHGSLT